jgi:ketosteroid isomerase-like protein
MQSVMAPAASAARRPAHTRAPRADQRPAPVGTDRRAGYLAGMSHDNVELVRRAYEAFSRRDFAAVQAMLHRDVRFQTTVETHHGPDGVAEWIRRADHIFDSFAIDVEELIDAGDRVVAVVHERGQGKDSGLSIDQDFAHVWSVSGGRISDFQSFTERAAALDAIGLPASAT